MWDGRITLWWVLWVFFLLIHPKLDIGRARRLSRNPNGCRLPSPHWKKKSQDQERGRLHDRKLLDNNLSTLAEHHRKTMAPHLPTSPKAEWGAWIFSSPGCSEVPSFPSEVGSAFHPCHSAPTCPPQCQWRAWGEQGHQSQLAVVKHLSSPLWGGVRRGPGEIRTFLPPNSKRLPCPLTSVEAEVRSRYLALLLLPTRKASMQAWWETFTSTRLAVRKHCTPTTSPNKVL